MWMLERTPGGTCMRTAHQSWRGAVSYRKITSSRPVLGRREDVSPYPVLPQRVFSGSLRRARRQGRSQRGGPAIATVSDESSVAPSFSLPRAVELAAAAFEAYLQPVGAEGFQERSMSGAEVTYTNRDFLSEVYQGVLRVELLSAKDLRVADFTGASDPYVLLSLGGCTAKSRTEYRTVNPVWKQSFLLYVKDIEQDVLSLRVYDEDFLKSDDDLGAAATKFESTKDGEPHEMEVKLMGPQAQGTVQLRCTFLPFHAAPLLENMVADGVIMPEKAPPMPDNDEKARRVETAVRSYLENIERQRKGGPTLPGPNPGSGFLGMPDLSDITQSVLKGLEQKVLAALSSPQGGAKDADLVEMLKAQVLAAVKSNATSGADDAASSSPWRVLASAAGCQSHGDCVPVAYVDNDDTDSQVWLYRNPSKQEVIVAFRGTEQVKWKDMATDLNLGTARFDVERTDHNQGLPLAMRVMKALMPSGEVLVHQGFVAAYDSVKREVARQLDRITGTGDGPVWKVYVTGHSLGGALATLCAYDLSTREHPARRRQEVSMYTYGAPRVGNKAFAELFNKAVRDSWRVTNRNDIVPSVPRLMGYCHVRHSVQLTSSGLIMIQNDDGKTEYFGEGKSQVEVMQEVFSKVTGGETSSWEDVYDEIREQEMQVLNTLVDGSALEQHMESFYLQTLQGAVLAAGLAEADKLKVISASVKK